MSKAISVASVADWHSKEMRSPGSSTAPIGASARSNHAAAGAVLGRGYRERRAREQKDAEAEGQDSHGYLPHATGAVRGSDVESGRE